MKARPEPLREDDCPTSEGARHSQPSGDGPLPPPHRPHQSQLEAFEEFGPLHQLGCVGVGLALATFRDEWWVPALSFALVSKLSYLSLSLLRVNDLGPLRRVAGSDVVALLVLALAAFVRR